MNEKKKYVTAIIIRNGYRYSGYVILEDHTTITIRCSFDSKIYTLPKSMSLIEREESSE